MPPLRFSSPPPLDLPPVGTMGSRDRFHLVVELLGTYLPMWRLLRTNDLPAMVAGARTAQRTVVVPAGEARATARRLGAVVVRVMRLLPTEKRCLIRSLVLVRMLANRGIPSRLVIGVSSDADFSAHAWVEHDGVPVLPTGGFARLTEL